MVMSSEADGVEDYHQLENELAVLACVIAGKRALCNAGD